MESYIGKVVRMIYIDRKRNVSFRDIRVLSVKDNRVKAYCYSAKSIRIFNLNGIVDMEVIVRAV